MGGDEMNTTDGTQGKRPSTCYLSHGSTIYRSQDIDVEKIPSWSNHIELATHSDNTLTDRYNDTMRKIACRWALALRPIRIYQKVDPHGPSESELHSHVPSRRQYDVLKDLVLLQK